MAGANGVTGPSGMPNGKSALRDSLPGVSFGAGVGARATSNAEDMAQRVNGLALQDDAIIAAGPSTSSSTSRLPDSQAPSVVLDDADPEAALLEHIYQRGFIGGEYGDVNLHYRPDRQPLKLHSLIVSRSPTIASLLQHPHSAQQTLDIFLPLNGYDQVTDDALVLAIGYLYSSRSLSHVNSANAPSVLLAAILLQITDLANRALVLCKEAIQSVSLPEEVQNWNAYLTSLSNGVAGKMGVAYEQELSASLYDRLSNTLPKSLHAFDPQAPATQQGAAQSLLQRVYAVLPFEMFKSVLESSSLGSTDGGTLSDQTRFNLAKKCIAERKKAAASAAPGADFEETVVLAFGGAPAGASNVSIVRKAKQSRKLWKVNG
ncbi:hypothetical protein P389DRAFT_169819 [Cystobasidium minutum MCA 4210]|uniref:uncharacterized protein n=1 Tax=Cystobasidium minutum MCA 4210 TaxID=1397322 RepID=UPI0034CE359E|eukprot:jgi/Rhomi1/169819/fgenesh1_kg.3_\